MSKDFEQYSFIILPFIDTEAPSLSTEPKLPLPKPIPDSEYVTSRPKIRSSFANYIGLRDRELRSISRRKGGIAVTRSKKARLSTAPSQISIPADVIPSETLPSKNTNKDVENSRLAPSLPPPPPSNSPPPSVEPRMEEKPNSTNESGETFVMRRGCLLIIGMGNSPFWFFSRTKKARYGSTNRRRDERTEKSWVRVKKGVQRCVLNI